MGIRDWFRDKVDHEPEPERTPDAPPLPAPPTQADIDQALQRVEAAVADPALSPAIRTRVLRLTRRLRETVARTSDFDPSSADGYALTAIATTYLPDSLARYRRLPRDWADTRPLEDGKTSLLLLIDQLDLLNKAVDSMYDAVLRHDAEALILQGRFLAAKFDAPAAPTPPPSPSLPTRPAPAASVNPLDLGE